MRKQVPQQEQQQQQQQQSGMTYRAATKVAAKNRFLVPCFGNNYRI